MFTAFVEEREWVNLTPWRLEVRVSPRHRGLPSQLSSPLKRSIIITDRRARPKGPDAVAGGNHGGAVDVAGTGRGAVEAAGGGDAGGAVRRWLRLRSISQQMAV
jgi:hypothetical protein